MINSSAQMVPHCLSGEFALSANVISVRGRLVQPEEQAAQFPGSQGENPNLKIGNTPQIHEQIIAVKTHEWAQVDSQADKPGHSGGI